MRARVGEYGLFRLLRRPATWRVPRLLFRGDSLPRESPRGYLCRVAEAHGYSGPLSLAQIAGLPTSGLERDDSAKQIAHVLRLEPEEWQAMCYRHVSDDINPRQAIASPQWFSLALPEEVRRTC